MQRLQGEIIDLSEDGVLINPKSSLPEEAKENRPVRLSIETDNYELEIAGRIVRVDEIEDDTQIKECVGIEFTEIGEKELENIRELKSENINRKILEETGLKSV